MKVDIDAAVIKIIEEVLIMESGSINLESRFKIDLPCNSIDFIMIISELEKKFKIELIGNSNQISFVAHGELGDFKVKHLVEVIRNAMARQPT